MCILSSCKANVGCFASCSAQLGRALSQRFFKVLATVVTVCVILLWSMVAVKTAIEAWKGSLFDAPHVPNEDTSAVMEMDPRDREVASSTPA